MNPKNETVMPLIFFVLFLRLWHRQSIVVSFLLLLAVLTATYYIEGAHQQVRGSMLFLFLPESQAVSEWNCFGFC